MVYNSTFEVIIIFNQNKLYQYFDLSKIISIVIDLNNMENIILLYCHPSATIYYLLVFFGLVFKINIDSISKKLVFEVGASIILKCIISKSVIIFAE